MDEQKLIQSAGGLLSQILTQHGIEGVIGLWIIYEKWIKPWRKKDNGEWISYKDIKLVKEKQDAMEVKLNGHLEKSAQEDLKINSMEKDIQYQGKEIEESKKNISDVFKILSEIKTLMIERGSH